MSIYAANNSWRGWNCQVTYSYVANNEYYSGTHSIHAWTKKRAEKLESSLKGCSIAVRYSPADHTLSTLLREDQIGGLGDF